MSFITKPSPQTPRVAVCHVDIRLGTTAWSPVIMVLVGPSPISTTFSMFFSISMCSLYVPALIRITKGVGLLLGTA
uniref:Uncharacterized protein n=1 Tax=Solanum lycopersicum TaxID=4081 RepID=A0A3Q7EFR1_SOLLC